MECKEECEKFKKCIAFSYETLTTPNKYYNCYLYEGGPYTYGSGRPNTTCNILEQVCVNDAYERCLVSFAFKGKEYYDCTTADGYDPWCYDVRGNGNWDYCSNCYVCYNKADDSQCDLLERNGYCTKHVEFMKVNCRKSCGYCGR